MAASDTQTIRIEDGREFLLRPLRPGVGQAIAGHGLGRLLMQCLLREARRRRLTLHGIVRRDNARMLDLCRSLGGTAAVEPGEPGLMAVRFDPVPEDGR